MAEALDQPLAFGALATQQCDLLGVLAHPNQVEAEVGLEALLLKVKHDQRRADPMGQRSSEDGIDQRTPHQIPRDVELAAGYRQWSFSGEAPEDHHKRCQRYHCT